MRLPLLRALLGLVASILLGCAASPRPVAARDDEASALSRAALDTLEREACPRLLTRTFPLAEPRGQLSTGRLWVRRCDAKRSARTLDLDVDVLGWQWSGEESWGFEVREYVYFSATIKARLSGAIEASADRVSLRVWTDAPPEVEVRAIGRVDAHASNPASTMLGAASALVGKGPNALATAALRGRVRELVEDRALAGIPIVIGEAPAVRGTAAAARAEVLLDEKQRLHPGGALISGSYSAGATMTLRWSVDGEGAVLARPVCVDEALELVDAVVAERAPPAARSAHDVLTLEGHGETTLAALACPWVLVTGGREDKEVTVSLHLAPRAAPAITNGAHRWIRATLVDYDLQPPSSTSSSAPASSQSFAVTFTAGPDDAPRSFGRALPSARSPSVELVAPLFEIARGAPIAVRALQQRPRAPSFWNPAPGYDETVLGRGVVAIDAITADAATRRQERRVPLTLDGRAVGSVHMIFDVMDVE